MKKIIAVFLIFCLAVFAASCSDTGDNGTSETGDASSAQDETSVNEASGVEYSDMFSDGDYKEVSADDADAVITLSETKGELSDSTLGSSGSVVTVMSKGTYLVEGSSENVQIRVNDVSESGNIYLLLNGVSMTNDGACVYVEAADKVIVRCIGENTLSSVSEAAVHSKDDLTVNGEGSLSLISEADALHCADDLKITGAQISIAGGDKGVDAGDSVKIGGGNIQIVAGHDGVQVQNDEETGFFYMESGSLNIDCGYDGIDAAGDILLQGGALSITSGGGSDNSKNSEISQKGLKCGGEVSVSLEAELSVSSADDAVHSTGTVNVSGGTLSLSSSDDGVHADGALEISGGTLIITKSYEGLEAETVNISGGTVGVNSADDGINAAGGSDSTSEETGPWGGEASGTLNISGGNVYINCSGDGLDSNGSIYVSGGVTIVEGPSGSDNGAIDYGDSADCVCSITGGTVFAAGSSGMAVNFNTGTQCSALVSISGSEGDEISVDDGSGFTFTASKSFECAVYSSPYLEQGSSYTVSAGTGSAVIDFTSSLYYSNVSGMGAMVR